MIRPRRSVLFMPGANARAMEKARALPADVIVLDLEDAVAPDAKQRAREQAAAAVGAGGYGTREVVIRVNGLGTPWGMRISSRSRAQRRTRCSSRRSSRSEPSSMSSMRSWARALLTP
jgi:hypothetical protein